MICSSHFFEIRALFLCHSCTILSLALLVLNDYISLLSWNPVTVILHFKLSLPTSLLEVFLFPLWHLYGCRTQSLQFRYDIRAVGLASIGKTVKYYSWGWTLTISLLKDVAEEHMLYGSDIYFSHLDSRTITTWFIWLLPWGRTQSRESPGRTVTYSENNISLERAAAENISFQGFLVLLSPFFKRYEPNSPSIWQNMS